MQRILVFLILLISILVNSFAQKKYTIKSSKVTDNIYKIEIGTVNLLAFNGDDGILLSDCGYKSTGKQLDSALTVLSNKQVKYIINTHWHHDHCGGNFYFNKIATIISHDDTKEILTQDFNSTFWQEEYKAFPAAALPDITFAKKMTLHFNNEEIELVHLPEGHTKGDIIVYFKESNVIHLGDLLFSFGFPAIDFEHGGSVKQFADNLQKIIEIVPDDIIIIAGHGPDFTTDQLAEYKNMLLETLAIIEQSIATGLDLDEITKNDVLRNFKNWENGYFSCNDWIEIVYKSLKYNQ